MCVIRSKCKLFLILLYFTSYLRTMTALLDPTQIEERERRRLKQLEQQVGGGEIEGTQ